MKEKSGIKCAEPGGYTVCSGWTSLPKSQLWLDWSSLFFNVDLSFLARLNREV
uniref:Uncharacterized protein n=1 Tax=Anguilla anguilla TaxID=7936 RepID=A0A0E9SI72_ANGAN